MMNEEQLQSDLEAAVRQHVKRNDKLKTWEGVCEKDGEPNYELLKRNLEIWISRHPEDMAQFMEYRKEVMAKNFKSTGASADNSIRRMGDMPSGLYVLFSVLSPNFLGQKEINPKEQKKRQKAFFKHFPVFLTCEKL